MRQLLGRANSSNVMKVIWLLEEMGLPYRRSDVGGAFGGNDTPEYRALNPNGLVPTLVEDEFVLWESNAVLRYLASANPEGAPFLPRDWRARALVESWMDWQHTRLGPPMTTCFWGLVRTAPAQRDMAAIRAAAATLGDLYRLLDARLAAHPYIAGPDFSLADIAIGVHAHRWFSFEGVDKPELPQLRAWYDRLLARPAFKAHVSAPPT